MSAPSVVAPVRPVWDRWRAWVIAPPRRLRPLAASRIAFGVAGVHWYLSAAGEQHLLFGPDGARGPSGGWSLLSWWSTDAAVDVLWWVGLGLAVGCVFVGGHLVVGAHTLVYLSFIHRNPLVADAGDRIATCILPLLTCAITDAHWSPVADRRRRLLASREVVGVREVIHNAALAFAVGQVALIYFSAALWKLTGRAWVGGTAVGTVLRIDAYRSVAMPWWVLDRPVLVNGLTWAVIALQASVVPVLLWARRNRVVAYVLVVALATFHLSTGLFMGLVSFALFGVAADLVLLPDEAS